MLEFIFLIEAEDKNDLAKKVSKLEWQTCSTADLLNSNVVKSNWYEVKIETDDQSDYETTVTVINRYEWPWLKGMKIVRGLRILYSDWKFAPQGSKETINVRATNEGFHVSMFLKDDEYQWLQLVIQEAAFGSSEGKAGEFIRHINTIIQKIKPA